MKISTNAYDQIKLPNLTYFNCVKIKSQCNSNKCINIYFERNNKDNNKLWTVFDRVLKQSKIKCGANKIDLLGLQQKCYFSLVNNDIL